MNSSAAYSVTVKTFIDASRDKLILQYQQELAEEDRRLSQKLLLPVVEQDVVDNLCMTRLLTSSTLATAILLALLVWIVWQLLFFWPHAWTTRIKKVSRMRQEWHPRSPEDCPLCSTLLPPQTAPLVEVFPWKTSRNRRGRKKRFSSEGVSCPNRPCVYFGCTVESAHAIVSCGVRGKTDHIRRWKCQACGTTVSDRRFTPLYRLKTPPNRMALILALLANDLDPSAAARVFRHDPRTIRR